MKKTYLYRCIVDDGQNVFSVTVPCTSAKDARKTLEGTGEVVKMTDVTNQYPISTEKVMNALKNADFGAAEQRVIGSLLENYANTIE